MKTGPLAGLEALNRRLQIRIDGIAHQLKVVSIGVWIIGVAGMVLALGLAAAAVVN